MGTAATERPPTCDRCGAIVSLTGYRARLDRRELILCPLHHREHEGALSKQGWAIERLTPPEPEAGPKERVRCSVCGGGATARQVKASPDSVAVRVVHCLECDVRTCNHALGKRPNGDTIKCDSRALGRDDNLCPKGHALLPEAAK